MEKEFGETLHSLRRFAANRARAMGETYLEGIQLLRHGTTPTLGKSYLVVLPLLQWEGLQRMQKGEGERRITLAAFAENLGVSPRRAGQLMRPGYQREDGVSVAEAVDIQKEQIKKALNRE